MQIKALSTVSQYNQYNQQNSKLTNLTRINFMSTLTVPKREIKSFRNKFLSIIASLAMLCAVNACQKEPSGPHPNGYQPSEIQHGNNSNYPDAPQEVMDEFIHWYEENCPIWNWPDYEGPYPDNWSELREQFQQDIINWWHEHGYPDWNGNVGG